MKIHIEPYKAHWKELYTSLQRELLTILDGLNPSIEHIGSTSVEGLSAKPVIDIMVGLSGFEPESVVHRLLPHSYCYVRAFNAAIPERRFFIRLKTEADKSTIIDSPAAITEAINEHKLAHIHVVQFGGDFWERHLAFREYLKHHPEVKNQYQSLKLELAKKDWPDAFSFNEAKDAFIKQVEKLAIQWYKSSNAIAIDE
jgi:GrpB-like predicted nucleotidyltransferase (UPF0157 family)